MELEWSMFFLRISTHTIIVKYVIINLGDIELNSNVNKGFQIVSVRIHRVDTLQDPLTVDRIFTILLFAQHDESFSQ